MVHIPASEVNAATFGSVFAYNYATLGFNINHGAHNSMNLYEGTGCRMFTRMATLAVCRMSCFSETMWTAAEPVRRSVFAQAGDAENQHRCQCHQP